MLITFLDAVVASEGGQFIVIYATLANFALGEGYIFLKHFLFLLRTNTSIVFFCFFFVQIGENRIFLLSSFRKRYSHILPIQSMKDSCFNGTSTPYLLLKCIAKCLYDTDTNYDWIVITTRAILCIYFFLI